MFVRVLVEYYSNLCAYYYYLICTVTSELFCYVLKKSTFHANKVFLEIFHYSGKQLNYSCKNINLPIIRILMKKFVVTFHSPKKRSLYIGQLNFRIGSPSGQVVQKN